jgi:hypothetical protein
MTGPDSCDPQILEPGEDARDEAGYAYGADYCLLTKDQMQALFDGKQLQLDINGREYVLFLAYQEAYKE